MTDTNACAEFGVCFQLIAAVLCSTIGVLSPNLRSARVLLATVSTWQDRKGRTLTEKRHRLKLKSHPRSRRNRQSLPSHHPR
jgi:hypothetical protein